MGAGGNGVHIIFPTCNITEELHISVNIKFANIIICCLTRALGIERDIAVIGKVVGGRNHGSGVVPPVVAAVHTVVAAVVAIIGRLCN